MGSNGMAEEGPGVGMGSGLGGGGACVSCDVNNLSMICLLHIAFPDNATQRHHKDYINKPAAPPPPPPSPSTLSFGLARCYHCSGSQSAKAKALPVASGRLGLGSSEP